MVTPRRSTASPLGERGTQKMAILLFTVRISQSFEFGFHLGDARPEGFCCGFDLFERESRGDVLGAVPVVGGDVEQHRSLDPGGVAGHGEAFDERRVVGRVDYLDLGKYLEPRLVRVIHQEDRRFVIRFEIADRDVLEVAAKICVAERLLIKNFQKSLWPAAKLYVRLAVLTDRRHVETIALVDERGFVGGQFVEAVVILEPLIRTTRSIVFLGPLDAVRERDLRKRIWHISELFYTPRRIESIFAGVKEADLGAVGVGGVRLAPEPWLIDGVLSEFDAESFQASDVSVEVLAFEV